MKAARLPLRFVRQLRSNTKVSKTTFPVGTGDIMQKVEVNNARNCDRQEPEGGGTTEFGDHSGSHRAQYWS